MATDTLVLSKEKLLGTNVNFVVEEGPFSTSTADLIRYADRIVLHGKHLPLAMGGKMWGSSKQSLQFHVNHSIFYRVVLGRHRWTLDPNHEEIMWTWLNIETEKRKGLERQLSIHKVTVNQITETKVIDTFDRMSDLEILQRLNDRTKRFVDANPQPAKPFSEDIRYKIAS